MSQIALPTNAGLRDGYAPPADVKHPPAGLLVRPRRELVVRGLPWITLLATAILGLTAPGITTRWDTIPFLLSFVLFGMPHGAMDWVVNQRMRRAGGSSTGLRGFAWYLAWMAIAAGALVLAPVLTVVAFFTLTVVHWGLGDEEATSQPRRRSIDRAIAVAGRGLLVLGSAFAFDPNAAWSPFAMLVGEGNSSVELVRMAGQAGIAALVVGTAATVVHAARHWSPGNRIEVMLDLGESLLIVLAIGLANPLFGIGVYFLFTHSYRHALRLASTPEVIPFDARGSSTARRLVLVHLLSLPLLIPTLAILLAWCRLQFGNLEAASITTTMIGFFLVTTLPHHLLGRRLPRPSAG